MRTDSKPRFLNNLPLLHFVQDQSVLVSPSPLLLASVLYISAVHSPLPELASLAGGYFTAICSAISELVVPSARPGTSGWTGSHISSSSSAEHTVFQDILGLIMASLSCEAYIETTDKWIALAYRLLLDHCPSNLEDATYDWRRLFSGIQVCSILCLISGYVLMALGNRHRTCLHAHALSPSSQTATHAGSATLG